jgi:hypothetical protein
VRLRDELLRAAVYEAFDAPRDRHGRIPTGAVERVVHVHRTAPAAEFDELYEALQKTRAELIEARRELALVYGRLAVLEVLA